MTNTTLCYFTRIEEAVILTKWEKKGFMQFSEKIKTTKEFWDIMSELIWLGYVDIII